MNRKITTEKDYIETGIFNVKNYMSALILKVESGEKLHIEENTPLLSIEDVHSQKFLECCYTKNIDCSFIFKNYSEKRMEEKFADTLDFGKSVCGVEKSLYLSFTSLNMIKKLNSDFKKLDSKQFPKESMKIVMKSLELNFDKLFSEIKEIKNDKELFNLSEILLEIFNFLHMGYVHSYSNLHKNLILNLFSGIYSFVKNKSKYIGFLSKDFRYTIQYDSHTTHIADPVFSFIVEYTPSRLNELNEDPTEHKSFFEFISPTVLSLKKRIENFKGDREEEEEIKNELFWFPYYELGLKGEERKIAAKFFRTIRQRYNPEALSDLDRAIDIINFATSSPEAFMENWPLVLSQIKISKSSDFILVLINIANFNPLLVWMEDCTTIPLNILKFPPDKLLKKIQSPNVIENLLGMYVFFVENQPVLHEKLFTRILETLIALFFVHTYMKVKTPIINLKRIQNLRFYKSLKYELENPKRDVFFYKFSSIINDISNEKKLLEFLKTVVA